MRRACALADEMIHAITNAYGFTIREATPLTGGFVNRSYRIETDTDTYFLRIHDLIQDTETVKQEHRLLDFLSEHQFIAPSVVRTASDETFITMDGTILSVYTWINGTPPNTITKEVVAQAAHALATYHHLVSTYTGDIPKWGLNIAQSPKETVEHALNGFVRIIFEDMPWEQSAYSIIERKTRHSAFERELLELKPFLSSIRDDIEDRYASIVLDDRVVVIHGDYWPNNLLFEDGVLVGIVDFDTARAGTTKFELMKGALEFSEFTISGIKTFMRAYLEVRSTTITVEEIDLYLRILSMWQIGQSIKQPILHGRRPRKAEIEAIRAHTSFLKTLAGFDAWNRGLKPHIIP